MRFYNVSILFQNHPQRNMKRKFEENHEIFSSCFSEDDSEKNPDNWRESSWYRIREMGWLRQLFGRESLGKFVEI